MEEDSLLQRLVILRGLGREDSVPFACDRQRLFDLASRHVFALFGLVFRRYCSKVGQVFGYRALNQLFK
jgi:hypothetical protein